MTKPNPVGYAVTKPSDMAEIFRRRAEMCRRAEETSSVKSYRRDWCQRAEVWEEATDIAARSFLVQAEEIQGNGGDNAGV